jgi:hypothetical protein
MLSQYSERCSCDEPFEKSYFPVACRPGLPLSRVAGPVTARAAAR